MTVLFHGNFPLHRDRMSQLLKLALAKPQLKDQELANKFGYGAPFSKLYRSWLHKTGIANLRLPLELTEFGNVIFSNDPGLQNIVTQWQMHHELVTDPERAEAWHFFALEFLPKHKEFSKDQLIDGLTEKLRPHSEMHFGPGSKLNRQIALKIIQVYTEQSGLGELKLIENKGDGFIRMDVSPAPHCSSAAALQDLYSKT